MFKNKFFLIIMALVVGLIAYSLFDVSTTENVNYTQKIKKYREDLNKKLLAEEDSPILNPSKFKGLNYFEPDSTYIFEGKFEARASTEKIGMSDGSGGSNPKVGEVSFEIQGQKVALAVFQEGENFFIPFKDATNTSNTYGGGRYLNIEAKEMVADKITLDFNKASNPYCAYNHNFVCPIPPKSNTLQMAINVGEKRFE
jgi:uncharacterized protein